MQLTKLIIYLYNDRLYSFAYVGRNLIYVLCDERFYASEAIFYGRVSRVNQVQKTAFVEYLPSQIGYLNIPPYLKIQDGSRVDVQLSWHGNSDKQAKLRYGWSLVGKYLIYYGNNHEAIISDKKCASSRREHLSKLLSHYPAIWGLRSASNTVSDEIILNEAAYLYNRANNVVANRATTTILDNGFANYLKILRSMDLAIDCEVLTNDDEVYEAVLKLQDTWGIDCISYNANLDYLSQLNDWQNLSRQDTVKLENGIQLEIGHVAGINIFDINTANTKLPKELVNFLALDEIVRQIYLRNLQGIILIDVIKNSPKEQEQKNQVYLSKLLRYDLGKSRVLGYSNSGLLEIIRNKF